MYSATDKATLVNKVLQSVKIVEKDGTSTLSIHKDFLLRANKAMESLINVEPVAAELFIAYTEATNKKAKHYVKSHDFYRAFVPTLPEKTPAPGTPERKAFDSNAEYNRIRYIIHKVGRQVVVGGGGKKMTKKQRETAMDTNVAAFVAVATKYKLTASAIRDILTDVMKRKTAFVSRCIAAAGFERALNDAEKKSWEAYKKAHPHRKASATAKAVNAAAKANVATATTTAKNNHARKTA